MASTGSPDPVEMFRQRAAAADLQGVTVIFRLSGGAPGDNRTAEEAVLSGGTPGLLQRRTFDHHAYSVPVPPEQTQALLSALAQVAAELTPRHAARFLPDTLVGAVEIDVEGDTTSLVYDAEPDSAEQLRRSDRLNDVIRGLERLLENTEGSAS